MFLYKNMVSDRVSELQQCLKDMGYYKGKVDGFFGPDTEESVIGLQKDKNLNADGVVGPKTLAHIKGMGKEQIDFPVIVPNGYGEILETFGNPLLSGYAESYLDFVATPKELNHVFKHINPETKTNGFYCNKLLVIAFSNVYQQIVSAGLEKELHTFDGCFNVRNIRGRETLSTHSWGIAVDHNAATNALGAKPTINKLIVKIFEGQGFVWGGNWKRPDGMHFQYAMGY